MSLGPTSADPSERFSRAGILQRFGDYELVSEIARGGMGVVYRARQLSLNREVAVKLILAGQLASPESLQRFRLEAQAAAQLHHPGIVRIYEIGEHDTQHFFSMELIDGVSLAECLDAFRLDQHADAAQRVAQEQRIAQLMARVARALDFAHQHGVLHRDVKPSNILIDECEQPHLTDFGLAKLTGRAQTGLTLSNAVLGTPGYLSPEQAAGSDDVTIASDVYGFGATLYELLTSSPPFTGTTAVETMWKSIHEAPPPPRKLNPVIHRDLETIVMRCLERKPDQRYPSAAAVADELERFLQRKPIQARPISPGEHAWRWCQRNPVVATLISVVLLAVSVGTGIAFWQWSRAEQANVTLSENIAHLEWETLDTMLESGQSSRALAKVASLLRADPKDWKAAMFGTSIMEQRRFPVPAAPQIRHPDGAELTVARLSPDGTRIVTASLDKTARLWTSETSEPLLSLQHEATVTWAEFSPDGKMLATCSEDKTVRLWDVVNGKAIRDPLRHDEGVVQVHFSGDGRFLLSRTAHTVSLYDVEDGRQRIAPLRDEGRFIKAEFVMNGQSFFVAVQAGAKSAVEAWNLETNERRFRLEPGSFADVDVNADLTRAVTIGGIHARIWETATGQPLHEFRSTPGTVMGQVDFSPLGDRIAVLGLNHTARIWTASGTPLTPELPHDYLLNGLGFLSQGDRLLSWANDSLAKVWDATTGEAFAEPMRHANRVIHAESGRVAGQEVFLAAISHENRRTVAAGAGTGAAQLWRVHEKRPAVVRSQEPDHTGHDGCRLNSDGTLLAVATTKQEVTVMESETGTVRCGPLRVVGGAWGVLFTPDSSRLITATSRGQVAVWSIATGQPVVEPVNLNTTIQPVDMTRDGVFFATGSTDGFVRVWKTETGKPVWEHQHGSDIKSEINSVAFSPDGRWLASGGENRITRVWEVASGQLAQEFQGHQNEVMRVAFSPDSRSLATACLDFTARLWDVSSGRQKSVLSHQGEVMDITFSPDGRYVATASRDRTAVIWNATTGTPHKRSLFHSQSVRNLLFTSDSRRLLTLDFHGPRLWDVESGHPLTVHLPHRLHGGTGFQSVSNAPNFTPDGQAFVVGMDSVQAILWHVPVPPADVPAWFPEFLEAVAGQRFSAGADLPESVPPSSFLKLKKQLLNSTQTNYYAVWARNWLKDL